MPVISPNDGFLAAQADIDLVARAQHCACLAPSTTRLQQPQVPEVLATLAPSIRELVR